MLPGRAWPEAGPGVWRAAHLARPGRLVILRTDLALLARSPETFVVHKLTAAAAGLASFALLGVFFAATGPATPWQIPARAFVAYLQLVRLARTAGAVTSGALRKRSPPRPAVSRARWLVVDGSFLVGALVHRSSSSNSDAMKPRFY